jgi:hypothetical protein
MAVFPRECGHFVFAALPELDVLFVLDVPPLAVAKVSEHLLFR